MPRVPQYNRSVQESNLPSVRQQSSGNATAYGGNIGQALQGIGAEIEKRAEQMQIEDDRDAVLREKANLDNWSYSYLYDQDNGALNKKGINANGITEQFNKDYDTTIQSFGKNLKNKRQTDTFTQYAMSQKSDYLRSLSIHQAKERKIASEESLKTANQAAIRNAIAAVDDDTLFNGAMDTLRRNSQSSLGSYGQDVVNAQVASDLSLIRTEQINNMLVQGNGLGARAFFDAHKKDIDTLQQDNIAAKINKVAVVQESRAVTDELWEKHGLDERAGMKELKERYGNNPDFEVFSNKYQAKLVDERRFKHEEERQAEENILSQIWQAGGLSEALEIIDGSGLPPNKKLYLENQAKGKFNTLASGKATPEQRYWINYERTGLVRDLETIRAFEKTTQDGDPTPNQQKTANIASSRLNSYWTFSSGGAYDPDFERWKETFPYKGDADTSTPSGKAIISGQEYDYLKNQGFSDEQINESYTME